MGKKPLGKMPRIFYGIHDFGFSFVGSMENYFAMIFLTDIAKLPLAGVGIAASVSYIIDAVMQPVYSALISAMKPMRWGRSRSYILLFPPLVTLTFITLFSKIGSPQLALLVCGASMVLTNATRTLSWTSNLNLINVLANNSDERAMLASRRATWASAGGIFFPYTVQPMIVLFGKLTGSEILSHSIVAGITGVFYTITCWFTVAFTKGYEATGAEAIAQSKSASQKIGFMDIVNSAIKNPYLLVLLVCDLFRNVANITVTSSAAYYFKYVAQNDGLMALYIFLLGITGTIGSYISAWVAKRLSSKISALVGLFGMGTCYVFGSFFGMNVTVFMVFAVTSRLFWGMSAANMVALYSDCVVYSRWKTGKNTAAFVIGSQTIPLKIGLSLRGVIIPLVLAMVGFSANIVPAEASLALKQGIINMFALIPGIGCLLTAIILMFAFRLTRSKVDEMQKEIDEREAAVPAV